MAAKLVITLICLSLIVPIKIFALSPVTISGRTFMVDGSPYYPTTHFLYSGTSNQFSHTYLALTPTEQSAIINAFKSKGYNTIYVYTFNQGDYSSAPKYFVSPYQNATTTNPWGNGVIDSTRLNTWYIALQNASNNGLRPVIWLIADDSDAIRNAPLDQLKTYVKAMRDKFDSLNPLWVVALEGQERNFESKANELGKYLNPLTTNPVGIHELSNSITMMANSWFDFGMYQYGFEYQDQAAGWQGIYNETLTWRSDINKPFIGAEYTHKSSIDNQKLGLGVAFGRTAGIGNGGPATNSKGQTLAAFMASLGSLDNYTPSKVGNVLYLTSSSKTAIANMDTLDFYLQSNTIPTPTPTRPAATPTPTPRPATPTPQAPSPTPAKIGDLDHDGDIDIFDYNLLVQHFNTTNCAFNITGSCLIDIFDYNLLIQNFGG